MKQTLERELKLQVGPRFRLPDLPGTPLPPRSFTSTYYDTRDHRLARAAITLRRRVEARKGVWQLKLVRGDARLELESRGRATIPPEEFCRLLFAHLRGEQVIPIGKLRTHRRGIRVTGIEGPLADVTLDSVSVLDGARNPRRFYQVEIELVGGSEKALRRIEAQLRDAGAGGLETRPKIFQALGLDLPSPPPDIPQSAPASNHLRAKLQLQVASLLAHDPGTRLGSDPEDLHQMRVATRRMRAFLRAARPMLAKEWADGLRVELGWLGSALGPVRDLDVLLEHLQAEAAALDPADRRAFDRMLSVLKAERTAARKTMLSALQSEQYLKLLWQLQLAAEAPEVVTPQANLRDFPAGEFKKLRRAMKHVGKEPSDKAIHRIRIRSKRVRYAAELAAAAVGKPATRYITEAKAFQDLLGQHQDAIVAEDRLRGLLAGTRGVKAAFTVGQVVERLAQERRESRAQIPKAWKRLEKRGQKAWLRADHAQEAEVPTALELEHELPTPVGTSTY